MLSISSAHKCLSHLYAASSQASLSKSAAPSSPLIISGSSAREESGLLASSIETTSHYLLMYRRPGNEMRIRDAGSVLLLHRRVTTSTAGGIYCNLLGRTGQWIMTKLVKRFPSALPGISFTRQAAEISSLHPGSCR